ncbi:MAG: HAMP domain-containing histidine kinase [Cyanobacteria bacterium]|nr:HAMP domain-containing histidine kinase [Cyanobacteriota bacterium]
MIRVNLTLGQKALILVLLPLLLDVVFLLALWHMVERSRQEAKEEEHARVLVMKHDLLGQHIADAAGSLAALQFTRNAAYGARYEERCRTARGDLADLAKLISTDSEKAALAQLKGVTEEIFDCLEESRQLLHGQAPDGANPLKMNKRINSAILRLRKIIDEANQIQLLGRPNILRGTTEEENASLIRAIIFGILGNLAVALALTIYFNHGATRRLKQLMTNTVLLAEKKEIMPCLEGGDEIAQLDQHFHEMARQLRDAERIKEEVMAMVSHDLRTPISSTLVFLELLSEGVYGEQTEDCSLSIGRSRGAMQRLLMMINDLLDFEKIQSGHFSLKLADTNLFRVVTRSIDSVAGVAESVNVSIAVDEPIDVDLHADEDRLVQVLVNVLANAIRFSPAGGLVNISVIQDDRKVSLQIIDQGPGISEEMRERIFEPYEQGGTAKSGFGLGLAICKKILNAHRGNIRVEPSKSGGSTFIIDLPLPADDQVSD